MWGGLKQQWHRVLFSDESRFSLDYNDGRMRVWRWQGERFADSCIAEHDRYGGGGGGGSIMVRGAIGYGNRTSLFVVPGGTTMPQQEWRHSTRRTMESSVWIGHQNHRT
jgi:hypothetical protein